MIPPGNILSPETLEQTFDVERVRNDFPILRERVNGKPLVYLDNAATSQKPQVVINALTSYYSGKNANVHRGVHFLSEGATAMYEAARVKVKEYLKAPRSEEIVFVRGTTEGINLVAHSYVRGKLNKGDEVLISGMEHHSNIVPWQIVCDEKEAKLKVIPVDDRGELVVNDFGRLLTDRTKFVSIVHVSNALGTINPVKEIIVAAHARGIPVLVDGAQAVPHMRVDVQDLDCDFYVFSSHKLFGPTGVGVIFGKVKLLESMPPYQGGGDMIKSVTFEKTVYNDLPYKFEAGTPHIAGVIGLGSAIDYLQQLDWHALGSYEHDLLTHATDALTAIDGLRIIGTAMEKASVISFVLENVHPHDVGTILDGEGIAIRTGHHCAQPVMERFGVPATARASFAFYNTAEEVEVLVKALEKVKKVFS